MKKRIFFLMLVCISALLLLTSCGKSKLTPGSAEVTLNNSGKKITVTVAPDAEGLEKYEDSRIYLFAMKPGRDISEIINGKAKPIDDKRAKSTVKFKLDTVDDRGNSLLYYGFIAAFFDSSVNKFVPAASTVAYISNPEVLSDNDTPYPDQASIKGINAKYDADAISLGVSHVIIDIPVDKYLSASKAGSTGISNGNKKQYINTAALTELDSRVKRYTNEGISVYFRITLEASADELGDGLSFLACEGTEKGLDSYTLNTADEECALALAGFLDFLAERYTDSEGKYGFVSAFIAGEALNTPGDGCGNYTYEAYLEACSVFMRILYTAMTSHYENGRVFLTVDRNYTVSGYGACDVSTKKFLSDFSAYARSSGDYPWGVALSTVSASGDSDRIWYDNAGGGKYITPSNLTVLTSTLLSAADYRYAEEPRHVIISDFSVTLSENEATEKNQASSLAYAYYKALATQGVDALFYSTDVDKNGVKSGLRSTDEDGTPTKKRAAFDLYTLIDGDTDISPFLSSALTGDSDWDKLYSENRESASVKRHSTGTCSVKKFNNGADPTDSYNFSTLFDFTDGSEHSFTASDKGVSIDSANKSALSVKLDSRDLASVGYVSARNIKKSKISNDSLLIAVRLGGGGKDSYTVTLTLIQKNAKKGDTVYVSSVSGVSGESEALLDFDISEFRRELKSGKLELRLSAYSEDSDSPACEMSVSRILIGKEKSNTGLIILLTSLAVTAIVLTVVLFTVWFKRNYKIERTPKKNGQHDDSDVKIAKNGKKATTSKKNNT